MTRLLLLAVLATVATGSQALDLDKLKKLEDKLKNPAQQSSPAPQAPSAGQQAAAPGLPAIPPIGNVPEADEVRIPHLHRD